MSFRLYVPYSDITEVGGLGILTNGSSERLAVYEKAIKTPLAFCHYGDYGGNGFNSSYQAYSSTLKAGGWKQISAALNWHGSHRGDHNLPIWMKHFPKNEPDEKLISPARNSMYQQHNSFAWGCGGRLENGFTKMLRPELRKVNPEHWYKFATIIRIPVGKRVTQARLKWLQALNYRELPEFATPVATYWVNGFRPELWPGVEAERDFWRNFKMPEHPGIKRIKAAKPVVIPAA